MTLVQEATEIIEHMPVHNQQVVVDLLRLMSSGTATNNAVNAGNRVFRRTGKSNFNLPADFDKHFDDMNDEIAALFTGDGT